MLERIPGNDLPLLLDKSIDGDRDFSRTPSPAIVAGHGVVASLCHSWNADLLWSDLADPQALRY